MTHSFAVIGTKRGPIVFNHASQAGLVEEIRAWVEEHYSADAFVGAETPEEEFEALMEFFNHWSLDVWIEYLGDVELQGLDKCISAT